MCMHMYVCGMVFVLRTYRVHTLYAHAYCLRDVSHPAFSVTEVRPLGGPLWDLASQCDRTAPGFLWRIWASDAPIRVGPDGSRA